MTEILTESFCERCGTRYTFESAKPRTRLKGVKVLSRGLKNFVLSDDTSIDEAMAAARSEADREASSHQLDAFHKTFNFCMSCRQYTCPNCWNEAEARCLSCAPMAIPEISHAIHDLPELRDAVLIGEAAPGNGAPAMELGAEAWPAAAEPEAIEEPRPEGGLLEAAADLDVAAQLPDEEADALEEAPVAAFDEPVGVAEEPIAAAADVELDESIAADAAASDEAAATAEAAATEAGDPADKAASQTLGLLRRFRPGQSLDAELDAYERERGEAVSAEPLAEDVAPFGDLAELQTERLAAASAPEEPETIDAAAALGDEPSAGAAEAVEAPTEVVDGPAEIAEELVLEAPESVVAQEPELEVTPESEPAVAPAPEPAAQPLAAAAASDVVEQPTWRITAPDPTAAPPAPGADQGGPAPVQPGAPARPAGGEPQWPARPEWPSASAAAGLPFLGRPATPQGGIDALWAASNQELVTAQPAPGKSVSGIQPCISCGLSLSATARFCRRCGTLQTR